MQKRKRKPYRNTNAISFRLSKSVPLYSLSLVPFGRKCAFHQTSVLAEKRTYTYTLASTKTEKTKTKYLKKKGTSSKSPRLYLRHSIHLAGYPLFRGTREAAALMRFSFFDLCPKMRLPITYLFVFFSSSSFIRGLEYLCQVYPWSLSTCTDV